jgi:hypothetical protein
MYHLFSVEAATSGTVVAMIDSATVTTTHSYVGRTNWIHMAGVVPVDHALQYLFH